MLAAAVVLIATDRRMVRAAAVQGLLPLVALVTLW
jgi:putative membrane protein